MTDVLSPISYPLQSPREARARPELSTGLGMLAAAWISLGLWAGLIAAGAGLLGLLI
jgi:hypothetical protein